MESIGNIVVLAMVSVKFGSSPNPFSLVRSPILWGILAMGIGVRLFFCGFPFLNANN